MLSGLAFVEEELEAERTALCGARYAHLAGRGDPVEEPQMFFGSTEMVFGAPLHPFIVRVSGYTIAHDLRDRFECFRKGFHRRWSSSSQHEKKEPTYRVTLAQGRGDRKTEPPRVAANSAQCRECVCKVFVVSETAMRR